MSKLNWSIILFIQKIQTKLSYSVSLRQTDIVPKRHFLALPIKFPHVYNSTLLCLLMLLLLLLLHTTKHLTKVKDVVVGTHFTIYPHFKWDRSFIKQGVSTSRVFFKRLRPILFNFLVYKTGDHYCSKSGKKNLFCRFCFRRWSK